MKRLCLVCMVMLLAGASTFVASFTVRLDGQGLQVTPQGNNFMLTWQAEVEEDVRVYEIERKTAYSNFTTIASVPPHGIRKQYQHLDDQVYKSNSEQLSYRLHVVYTNGLREQLADRQINYSPTAVRRTWGSIKAMFQ